MAPSVRPAARTVLSAARTGVRVARVLLRPARPDSATVRNDWGLNDWGEPDPALALRRGASLARRGLGLAVLFVLALIGAGVLGTAALLTGIGVAEGHAWAGWLLGLSLLLLALGAFWTLRRARALMHVPPVPAAALPHGGAARPLGELRREARALPPALRPVLDGALRATGEALRASADDRGLLTRDVHDARRTAQHDLPELLALYRGAPRTPRGDVELAVRLRQIETRMAEVARGRGAERTRDWQAYGRYLEDLDAPADAEGPRKP